MGAENNPPERSSDCTREAWRSRAGTENVAKITGSGGLCRWFLLPGGAKRQGKNSHPDFGSAHKRRFGQGDYIICNNICRTDGLTHPGFLCHQEESEMYQKLLLFFLLCIPHTSGLSAVPFYHLSLSRSGILTKWRNTGLRCSGMGPSWIQPVSAHPAF